MNVRIIKTGFKLLILEDIKARYYSPVSISDLISYAFKGGKWNGITLRLNNGILEFRHLVPVVFIVHLALCLVY